MLDDLKYDDGSIQGTARIPDEIKERYPTAFEIDATWLIACAARRQKWIDMGQSLNLYVAEPSGRVLSDLYRSAWRQGLKTTYYLRSRGATQNEKSTLDVNRRAIQPRWMRARSASADVAVLREGESEVGSRKSDVGATPASPASSTATLPAVEDDAEAFICEACQ
ncbi:MAG: ribonucleoside-diphosphate reductase, alpha subunit [Thermomicrobiales bacterium]|nr:ribonucleoside-diphosphate reductase, alpha subunit [Thermomicrobiales bacterium]